MVGYMTLNHVILVRIQARQHSVFLIFLVRNELKKISAPIGASDNPNTKQLRIAFFHPYKIWGKLLASRKACESYAGTYDQTEPHRPYMEIRGC